MRETWGQSEPICSFSFCFRRTLGSFLYTFENAPLVSQIIRNGEIRESGEESGADRRWVRPSEYSQCHSQSFSLSLSLSLSPPYKKESTQIHCICHKHNTHTHTHTQFILVVVMAEEIISLTELLARSAQTHGDNPSLISSGGPKLTHAGLQAAVDAAAAQLIRAGVKPGDVVALTFPNSIEVTCVHRSSDHCYLLVDLYLLLYGFLSCSEHDVPMWAALVHDEISDRICSGLFKRIFQYV